MTVTNCCEFISPVDMYNIIIYACISQLIVWFASFNLHPRLDLCVLPFPIDTAFMLANINKKIDPFYQWHEIVIFNLNVVKLFPYPVESAYHTIESFTYTVAHG